MKKPVKNFGKSNRAKLLSLMKTSGKEYMHLLARYFNERLLYRVSVSRYRENFLLKGGSLLYAMDGLDARPTIDVDFMANRISRDRDFLENVFKEIMSIPCEEDGVVFETESIHSDPITVEKEYPGSRIYVTAHMDTINFPMSMDVGFGDVVTPGPVTMDFPLLIATVPAVKLQTYSIETVIAEKFHAMIDRDVANSRMKDFFDCYQILTTKKIEEQNLGDAIFATFSNRQLAYNSDLQLFLASFSADEKRLKMWKSFLKSIKWNEEIPFDEVLGIIRKKLKPYLDEYWSQHKE